MLRVGYLLVDFVLILLSSVRSALYDVCQQAVHNTWPIDDAALLFISADLVTFITSNSCLLVVEVPSREVNASGHILEFVHSTRARRRRN